MIMQCGAWCSESNAATVATILENIYVFLVQHTRPTVEFLIAFFLIQATVVMVCLRGHVLFLAQTSCCCIKLL